MDRNKNLAASGDVKETVTLHYICAKQNKTSFFLTYGLGFRVMRL